MKTCPNCGELVGDNVSKWFNCYWKLDDPSENERAMELEKERRETEERVRIQKQEYEQERRKLAAEQQRHIEELNGIYEYKVLSVIDSADGSVDTFRVDQIINEYARQSWKLLSIFTNEIGRNRDYSGTNATIDETIIVMERMKQSGIRR